MSGTRPASRHLLLALLALGLGGAPLAHADTTITYGDWQLAETVSGPAIRAELAKFEQANPGIKVVAQPVAQGSRDVVYGTAFRAGGGPDVYVLDQVPVTQYIRQGWAVDLSPYIAQAGGAKYLADFYPSVTNTLTVGGKIYGVPLTIGNALLFSDMTVLHRAGISDPPKTWPEFRADAIKATLATIPGGPIDEWGFPMPMALTGFNSRFPAMLFSYGGNLITPDFKHSAMLTPETKAAFEDMVDMVVKDRSEPPGVTSMDTDPTRQLMAQDKVAFLIEPTSFVANLLGINPKFDVHTLRATALPVDPGHESELRATMAYKAYFINPNSKDKDAAWKLIEFLAEPEQLTNLFLATAGLPPRISLDQTLPQVVDDPFNSVSVAQIPRGQVVPAIQQWPQIMQTVRQNATAAMAGSKSADQALNDANTAIETLLQQPQP